MFGIIIGDLLTPTAATSAAASAAKAAATCAAEAAAPTAAERPLLRERPLLSERPALRAALRELSRLASTAHIAKGTAWALSAGETLAATGRPLGRPAHTADTSNPAGTTGACPGHPASSAGPAYPADTSNTASPAGPAYPADTSYAASPAGPAYPADTSYAASPAGPANPAGTSYAANPAGPAYPADTSDAANPANTADAGRGLHGATRHRHLRTAGQSDGAVGGAREVCRPVASEICLEPVRRDLPAVHADVVPAVDVYVGITAAPRGSCPAPQAADHRRTGSESKPGSQCVPK